MLERSAHERLVRQEHDDELGSAGQLPPVGLLAELLDVVANVPRMIRERRAALVVRDVLAERIEIRDERHLRVDDDVLLAGEVDDHVRPEHVAVGRQSSSAAR